MALFVDGPACTIDDLTDQDSGLLGVAGDCGINVSTKMRLATDEIQTELQLWIDKRWGAARMILQPVPHVEQIVVNEPLKRWEIMHSLALVYRDAYHSQLVDRYQAKWREYAKVAREVREACRAGGIGLVSDPVTRAMPPVLSATPGPQPAGTFYASVAWVNRENQEGATSYASSIAITDGHLMQVNACGGPVNATGFNVYAGKSLKAMYRQNDVPLPVNAPYLYIPGQITQGRLPGNGQLPEFVLPVARTSLRG